MGYFRSPTIEDDIEVLEKDGQIVKKDKLYELTKKGREKIIPMPEDWNKELVSVVKEVQGLSHLEAENVCKDYYQRFKRALQ